MATLNMKLTVRSKFSSHCLSTDQMLKLSNVRYCNIKSQLIDHDKMSI